jgi:hypothetical protein
LSGVIGSVFRKILKFSLYAVGGILLLFALIWGALQFPQVQTFVVGKATNWVSGKTHTRVEIGRVDIDFFKTLVLEDIYLEDQQKDTLLYAGELKVNIGVLGLRNSTVVLNLIGLDNAVVNLKKSPKDSTFNYQFLIDAFVSDTTTTTDTTSSSWTVDLEELDFNNFRFNYADPIDGNDLRLSLQKLETNIETLGLNEQHPRIENILLEGLNVAFEQPFAEADTLGATLAKATQTDSIAAAVEQSITKAPANTSEQDSLFNSSGYALNIGEIRVVNSTVRYEVKGAPRVANQFNYQHLFMQDLNLLLKDLVVGENDFAAKLQNLAFKDQSGVQLNQLTVDLQADMPRAEVKLNTFRTPNSALDNVRIVMASTTDTERMLRNLRVEADFEDDSLAVRDLAYFTDAFDTIPVLRDQKMYIDGDLRMANARVDFNNLRLAINDQNYIRGSVSATEIDSLPLTYANLQIAELRTNMDFIARFLPAGTLPAEAMKLGQLSLSADVSGKLSGAKAQMSLQSGVGQVDTDLNLRTNDQFDRNYISGTVRSTNLNAAKLVGNGLGQVAFVMELDASQVKDEIAVNKGDLLLKRLSYNDYTYRNIQLRSTYLKNLAKASVSSPDTNLQLEAYVMADMTKPKNLFNFNAEIKNVNPRKLNLSTDTLEAGLKVSATIEGIEPDDIVGDVILADIRVDKAGTKLALDTMVITARKENQLRTINLDSDLIKAGMSGQFTVEGLPLALDYFINNYFSAYPVPKQKLASPQLVDFYLDIKKNPELIEAFVPGLRIPQAIHVKGSFVSNANRLVINGSIPQVIYGDQRIDSLLIKAGTNEDKLSLNIDARRIVAGTTTIPEPSISGAFDKDNATFGLRLAGDDADSRLNLNGRLQIRQDTFYLRLLPSEIFLEKQRWEIADDASITYGPEYIWIDDLIIRQGDQTISVTSQALSASNTLLNVEIRRLNVGEIVNLVQPMGYTIGGLVYGNATLSDIFKNPSARVDLNVVNFAVNNSEIGDVSLRANKAAESEQLGLSASILGQGNDITLDGEYNTVQTENNLNLKLSIGQIRLEQFAAFAKDYIKEMEGGLRANMLVRGSTSKPVVTGSIFFDDALINAAAINVPYRFNKQEVVFKGDHANFNKFTILDDEQRTLVLTGGFNFADLEKMAVDMQINSNGFQFLNTSEGNDQPVYGKVFASTNLSVKGPVESVVIGGDIQILKNTLLGVPILDGSNDVNKAEYIQFVTYVIDSVPPPPDTLRVALNKQPTQVTGFTLDTRIRVSPEAIMRIVIDPESGDMLECSGQADLRVRMNPNGDINMVGDYVLESGQYSMTLLGVVGKEFSIRKGSTIQWTGDPTNANVDITAVYETKAARYDLVGDMISENSVAEEARTQAPVFVYLKMQGQLLEPVISFDLEIPRSMNGQLDQLVNDRINTIKNDESELNKQVFGLIALNRFIGMESGNAAGGSTADAVNEKIGQSVSQLLTSQLNKLSDEYLGGVEISVDLKDRAQDGSYSNRLNDKQLAVNLSKQLLNDRLTVSVGSNVGLGNTSSAAGGANANTNPNNVKNIIGDFSVQYRLLESGRLNLKIFRRVNPNPLATSQEIIGVSLMHTKSFRRFKDLFRKKKKREAIIQ